MSALPEWLWPMEDEEAVQEAERLIEETHNALRRMEAGMKDQRMSGQHLSEAAEKLKSEVNRKMHALEKELKSISEPTSVDPQPHKKGSANEHHKLKPVSTSEEGYCRQHPNLNASTSQSKSNPKLNDHITAQQQAQNISISHPLPKQWKNVDPKWNSSTAEQVVLTARAKVQDALAVARNVTASLDHHAIESSVHSKPMPKLQARNVGIFEVKSHSDRKIVAPKRRLGQTLLPSISIKRGLEKQSIPSIQVLPGEKTTLSNVFVCNMKHDDHVEGGGDCQNKITLKESAKCSVQHQSANTTTSKINDDEESAVVQLSRQLAEVEELREVNQAQVNHVLRFLLSRVCNSSPTQRATRSPTDSQNKVCDQQDKSHTTSSSDSSQCPIAYDSLSRFLETYKRAANQSMLARKRATVRRQKEVAKQKKEIEKAQTFAENHLLIGPLRQGTQVKGTDFNQSKLEPQDLMESYSTSSSSNKEVDLHENAEMDANSFKENGNESMTSKEMRDWNSPLQSMESGSKESILLPVKSVGGVSVEDYEDDWEEEDNHNKSSNLDEGESLSDSILPPIIETEELASSVTRSENQKQSINSPKVEQKSSKLNTTQTIAIEKETAHQEGEKKEMHEEDSAPLFHTNLSLPLPSHLNGEQSIISVQTEQTDDRLNQGNIQIKPLYLSNSRSMSGERQDEGSETPVAGISQEKPPSTTSGSKVKQHQSTLRRSVVGHHSLCSSSSDAEMNNDSRPSRSSRRQDLSLREDLQLQSAILLNWQLEERLKKNSNETSVVKDQPNLPSLQTEVLTDIERRWQRTLDLLDQRLKMIEDNERIHRIANEIKLHSRLECTKPNNHEGEKHVPTEERNSIANTRSNSEVKVPTKDMMVQTSPEKNKFYFETKEFEPLLSSSMELLSNRPEPQNRKFVNSSWQKSLQPFEDLTAELLKYSNMGILPRLGHRERQNSKSSSSSTTSSNFQQSCAMVSFSDGELRNSASGSCSCSEGEYCVCGGRKLCSERAPPDGSQTLSDGENFMKDVSQGEIPSSKLRHLLKDTSFGEIAYHAQEVPAGDPYMAEESIESDDIDWELK